MCFDNDAAGRQGAERVARLIPRARVVRLPEEVGGGGDVTDFFVRLGRSREDFVGLLDTAALARGATQDQTGCNADAGGRRQERGSRAAQTLRRYRRPDRALR